MLIRGDKLTEKQRSIVLSVFGYRWTAENESRAKEWTKDYGTQPEHLIMQTDQDWLKGHAFHFIKDGSRLMFNRHFCEPHYTAD
jgi:hypothetical protein